MSVRAVVALVVVGESGAQPPADPPAELAAAFERCRAVQSVLTIRPASDTPRHDRVDQRGFLTSAGPADLAARVDTEILLLHNADAPRPPDAVIDAVLAAVAAGADAAIPVAPMSDTVKVVDADGFVIGVEDRDRLRVWQWPWAVRRERLAGLGGSWSDWASGASLPVGAALIPVSERVPSGLPGPRAMIAQ
jgi:hypothetical protein